MGLWILKDICLFALAAAGAGAAGCVGCLPACLASAGWVGGWPCGLLRLLLPPRVELTEGWLAGKGVAPSLRLQSERWSRLGGRGVAGCVFAGCLPGWALYKAGWVGGWRQYRRRCCCPWN